MVGGINDNVTPESASLGTSQANMFTVDAQNIRGMIRDTYECSVGDGGLREV